MKHIIEDPKDSFWTIFKDTNDWNEKAIIGATLLINCDDVTAKIPIIW